MKSMFIFLILSCLFFNLSCGSNSDDNASYSFTITDPTFTGTNPKFIAAVYKNGVLQTGMSVSTAQDLTGGNSITISSLAGGTPYDIFVWIDVNGDGSYGLDMKGYVTLIQEINADVELENDGAFMDFEDKQIVLTYNPVIATKTIRCFWLLEGSLDESVMDLLGGTEEDRSTVTTMVGSITEVLDGSGDMTTEIGTDDFPVPANSTIDFFGIEYDCYCIVDVNGNETRDSGDYDGQQTFISGDGTPEPIALTEIFFL